MNWPGRVYANRNCFKGLSFGKQDFLTNSLGGQKCYRNGSELNLLARNLREQVGVGFWQKVALPSLA